MWNSAQIPTLGHLSSEDTKIVKRICDAATFYDNYGDSQALLKTITNVKERYKQLTREPDAFKDIISKLMIGDTQGKKKDLVSLLKTITELTQTP